MTRTSTSSYTVNGKRTVKRTVVKVRLRLANDVAVTDKREDCHLRTFQPTPSVSSTHIFHYEFIAQNGVTTVEVEEDGVLVSRTVDGVPDGIQQQQTSRIKA
eukprot:Opistho-2@24762